MLQYQHMFCTIGSGGCTRNICISSFILPSRLMLSTLAFSQFSAMRIVLSHKSSALWDAPPVLLSMSRLQGLALRSGPQAPVNEPVSLSADLVRRVAEQHISCRAAANNALFTARVCHGDRGFRVIRALLQRLHVSKLAR